MVPFVSSKTLIAMALAGAVLAGCGRDLTPSDNKTVGVGMWHGLLDLADDDLRERRGHGRELFDLQAGHGQGVGQLLRGKWRVAELSQPGFGKLHSQILWRAL